MVLDNIKDKLLWYMIALGTVFFLLGSGGSAILRVIGFLILISSFWIHMIKCKFNVPLPIILSCACFCLTFVMGIVVSILNDSYTSVFYLTVLIVFMLPLFIFIYNSYGQIFVQRLIGFIAWSLIIVFFSLFVVLFFMRQQFGPALLVFLNDNYSGGFYYRSLFSFDNFPLIWFQFSILAMPLAIWHLFAKKYLLFSILTIVVFLSLNRTGSFVIIFFFFLSLIRSQNFIGKLWLYFLFILPVLFLIICVFLHAVYAPDYVNNGSGFSIRLGHVVSTFNYLYRDLNLIVGMGADAPFETLGRDEPGLIVRDQEISFLEILRRFGLIGYGVFNIGLIVTFLHFYRIKCWQAFYSLLCYVLFSFTNPSLISFIFVIFYAIISTSGKKAHSSDSSDLQSGSPALT